MSISLISHIGSVQRYSKDQVYVYYTEYFVIAVSRCMCELAPLGGSLRPDMLVKSACSFYWRQIVSDLLTIILQRLLLQLLQRLMARSVAR